MKKVVRKKERNCTENGVKSLQMHIAYHTRLDDIVCVEIIDKIVVVCSA